MSPGRPAALTVLITIVLLVFASASAEAAQVRFLSTSGTATAAGTVTITIETFGKPGYPGDGGPGIQSQTTVVTCPVLLNDTAVTTTTNLMNSLNAQLPPGLGFTASISGGCTTTVNLYNSRAPFGMTITSTVSGQTTVEVATSPCWTPPGGTIPTLSEWGLIILTAGVILSGVLFLRRRRNAGLPA